jgi:hypothetical protein
VSGGEAKKDSSKSTAEGEWEMRDGKWYRKDYYAIEAGKQQQQTVKVKCPNCPTYQAKIEALVKEREELRRILSEKERIIVELNRKIEHLEAEKRAWLLERQSLLTRITERETRIKELERLLKEHTTTIEKHVITIREKETIITSLQQRIRELMDELARKQAIIDDLLKLRLELEARLAKALNDLSRYEDQSKLIELLEEQIAFCKLNHVTREEIVVQQPPPVETVRWYYAVQNPQHAQMFQMERSYAGGDIVVDALEGATVVNPEYYSQSERVAGNARLRVRVVSAHMPGFVGQTVSSGFGSTELFIRLRLGNATQFTQPRPASFQAISWHQDFVFVGVPTEEHPTYKHSQMSVHPLVIEVVSRVVGTASETVIGSGTVELADLIFGLTRQCTLSLTQGGTVNVRVKALDFGLPSGAPAIGQQTTTTQSSTHVISHSLHSNDALVQAVFGLRKQDMYGRMDIEDEQRAVYEQLLNMHRAKMQSLSVGRGSGASIFISGAQGTRRMDATTGFIPGRFDGLDVRNRFTSDPPAP